MMDKDASMDFLYAGLGSKSMSWRIRIRKSNKKMAPEKAAMTNHKISDWIVKDCEETKEIHSKLKRARSLMVKGAA